MSVSVEVLAPNVCTTTGEGPHWEASTGNLLFVDIMNGGMHRYHVETRTDQHIQFDCDASFVIPRQSGGYVAGLGRRIVALDFETKVTTTLAEIEAAGENRLNDAKCDARGRLWAGSMGEEPEPAVVDRQRGVLGCLDTDGRWTQHRDGIDISNGMAWSRDGQTMFYIDSLPRKVYAFDYDDQQGTISGQRVLFDFATSPVSELGFPDGCCIDADDQLWVACFSASKVIQIDTNTGTKLREVLLPTQNITSCCWGGALYQDLYVTSGRRGVPDDVFMTSQPTAGSVFRISGLGAKGLPGNIFRG